MGSTAAPAGENPILVAVDLSERFDLCMAHGCELASKLGLPLLVAHVVHETAESAGSYRRQFKNFDTTPMHDIARTMLEERVAAFRRSDRTPWRECEIRLAVVDGLPGTRIPELAERYDAAMILMCSRNRTGLRRFLHGSITESVTRRSDRPVVIVGQGCRELSALRTLAVEAQRSAGVAGRI